MWLTSEILMHSTGVTQMIQFHKEVLEEFRTSREQELQTKEPDRLAEAGNSKMTMLTATTPPLANKTRLGTAGASSKRCRRNLKTSTMMQRWLTMPDPNNIQMT